MSNAKTFEVNGYSFTVGDLVTAEVTWKDGRRIAMTGNLLIVYEDEAYIKTSMGDVVADANTLEPA